MLGVDNALYQEAHPWSNTDYIGNMTTIFALRVRGSFLIFE
jgi:hypothetical protein